MKPTEQVATGRRGGPLAGVRVLELSHYIAGPHCAMILADHGADVIKLEPLAGERGRYSPPYSSDGDSLYFACHNRQKRSVAVDLRHPGARAALDPLLRWADVVVTNHVPGVPERLGFGYERLSRLNPRAILVHITGYGTTGPYSRYVAFDGAIQAMSGFSSMTGEAGGDPLLSQVLVADHVTGGHAASAAMAALFERERTGHGRLVEVSMLASMTSMLAHFVPAHALLGDEPKRQGSRSATRFVNIVPAADAGVYIAPITPPMWREFCRIVGVPEWGATEPQVAFADAELRQRIWHAVEAWMLARTAAEAVEILQASGIACGAVRSVAQLYRDEVASPTGSLTDVTLPGGQTAPVPGPAFRYPGEDWSPRAIPVLGAATEEVLREAGVDTDLLNRLRREGVLGAADPARDHEGEQRVQEHTV